MVVPDSNRIPLQTLENYLQSNSVHWDSVALKLFNIKDINLSKFLKQLHQEKLNPLNFTKTIKAILNIICDSKSPKIKHCNLLLDCLLEILESIKNNTVENYIIGVFNFISILNNQSIKLTPLINALTDYSHAKDIQSSLNLIYQYTHLLDINENSKAKELQSKIELLSILEYFHEAATENFKSESLTKFDSFNFIIQCFLDRQVYQTFKSFSDGFKSQDSLLTIEVILKLTDLLEKSNPVCNISFNKKLLETSKYCLDSASGEITKINVLNNENLNAVLDYIKSVTEFFSTKFSLKKDLFDLASNILNSFTCLLCYQNSFVNRATIIIYLYMSLMKLFSHLPESIHFKYAWTDIENTSSIQSLNEFDFSFTKQAPPNTVLKNSKLTNVNENQRDSESNAIDSNSQISKIETVNLEELEKLQTESSQLSFDCLLDVDVDCLK